MRINFRFLVLVASLTVFGLLGCGERDPRLPVSGTVSYKNQPLQDGLIEFFPEEGVSSRGTSGAIIEGEYSIPKQSGLVPGKYRVSIHSGTTGMTLPEEPPGPGVRVARELIPGKYNTKSNLTAEVKEPGPNVFDFPLTP